MARTYKRDSRGRFSGGGGSSRGGGRKPMQRGTNRLTRDNAGRITSVGGDGATARGGRLRTASGRQRATVTARGIGKAPAGTVGRSGGRAKALPAAKPAAAAKPAKSPRTPRIKVKTVKMWHGTTPAAASKIRKGGFRESKDGVYGDGVYAGTKAVARQYGRAAVAIRIPAFKIKDASGSSRQIRALANQLTPSGKVVRWQHSVADRPKQSAFTLSTADANKYRQRIRGSGRRLRISS